MEQRQIPPAYHPAGKAHSLEPAGPVGLYVHVPFCRSICTYCAFAKQEYTQQGADRWLEGLEREMRFRSDHTWGRLRVDTVFLGGGTPSALSVTQWLTLGRLLATFFDLVSGVEMTSEANPESFSKYPERLEAMIAAGVNRISLGVQSAHSQELALLGRPHGRGEVEAAVSWARASGVMNLNLDLMYGLPQQTAGRLEESIDWLLGLEPDHISGYCLGLEPGTPLAGDVSAGKVESPQDDMSRTQYEILCARMEGHGLEHYEISNWARPGRACRHNLKYWKRENFAACGPSAHGLMLNQRWANPAPLERWLEAYQAGKAPVLAEVPLPEAQFEWIFLNLRVNRGFHLNDYSSKWSGHFLETYQDPVDRMAREGLLEVVEDRVRLTPAARFLSDGVFAEFAPPRMIKSVSPGG